MGRPREFDLEEAVATAAKLFWRGFDRTSLAELTSTLGVGSASFYFAFGSKEALFRRAVNRYLEARSEAFDRAFQEPTVRAAVEALLRGYADIVTDPEHAPGCLVVNTSPSACSSDALREWLSELRATLRARLEHQFRLSVESGKLPRDFNPNAMARFIATLSGGLVVEAQSGASREELYSTINSALKGFPRDGQE